MAPRRILVTRSEPEAHETAARLRERGYEPLVEPLFGVEPLNPVLPDFEALAFTSLNGVRMFAPLSERRDAAAWCVGDRTADAARAAGFQQVVSAEGDADALVQLIAAEAAPGTRLLHTGNEASHGEVAGKLRAKGIEARFIATFWARPVAHPGLAVTALLGGAPAFDAALVHSQRAGSILARMLAASGGARTLPAVAAISHKAAHDLASISDLLEVAHAPNENALLDALDRIFAEE